MMKHVRVLGPLADIIAGIAEKETRSFQQTVLSLLREALEARGLLKKGGK